MKELATNLKENDAALQPHHVSTLEVYGVRVFALTHEIFGMVPSYELPANAHRNLLAEKALFNSETLPAGSEELIREVEAKRTTNGCAYPVDIISAMHFISMSEEGQAHGMEPFDMSEHGIPDFTNVDKYRRMLEIIISTPELRKKLVNISSVRIPDEINDDQVDAAQLAERLEELGLDKDALILDLGCGTGKSSQEIQAISGMKVVGVERQYHAKWYDPQWKSKNPNLTYLRADFVRGIPLPDCVVDTAILKHVINHMTADALEQGLRETARVLKPGGYLLVCPQFAETIRTLQKTEDGNLTDVKDTLAK